MAGIARDDADRWIESYRQAWESGDSHAAAALFSDDARYWSSPFRDPHVGRAGVLEYWSGATGTQSDTRVVMGTPLVDGSHVAVEWWASFREDGDPITLPGVLLLAFGRDGLCTLLRENWCYEPVTEQPFDGWGVMSEGDSGSTRAFARAWARGYWVAWHEGNAEAVGRLYAPDSTFRSAPLREPKFGREGVLEYTRWAMGQEVDQDPVFAEPIVDGNSAAVEWWCPMTDEGKELTLSGCSIQTYDEHGLVVDERDYWNQAPGLVPPHRDWGPRL